MITPPQVISTFARLTGIAIRHVSHGQEAQALAFCAAGFSLEELGAVIGYVQQQIRSGKLDERSLAWRNIFGPYGGGSEFDSFQDRLAFATKAVRLRPEPKAVATSKTVDAQGTTFTVLESCQTVATDSPDMREQVSAQLAELRKSMSA